MADDVKKVPEYIECGESGGGSLEDAVDGNRSRRLSLKYVISNHTGYDSAEKRMEQLAPLTHKGMRRGKIQCDPVGGGWFLATVEYANESVIRDDDLVFSGWEWETSEKSERITQAFVDKLAPGPNQYVLGYSEASSIMGVKPGQNGLPNFQGAIGVEGDQVRGVEKPMALFNWSETWICPAYFIVQKRPPRFQFVDDENGGKKREEVPLGPLEDIVAEQTFCTNKFAFRGKPPGCVLLTGVRSGRMHQGSSTATLTFSFSYAPRKDSLLVGPILINSKDGWDYLDIYYETAAETEEIIKRPKWVYVHRIFDRVDFRDLGLPTKLPPWWLNNKDELPGHVFDTPFGK